MRQLVEVEWVDSTHVGGWSKTDDVVAEATNKTVVCKTVGYLLAKEPDRVAVVQNMSRDEEISDSLMIIPAQSVMRITYLVPGTPAGTTSD